MMRDEILHHLTALPPEADVVIQVGSAHVAIAGLARRGDRSDTILLPHPADLRDALIEWGVPVDRVRVLMLEAAAASDAPT